MLAFAHIPIGANKGFNIDEVNSRLVEPAFALTAATSEDTAPAVSQPGSISYILRQDGSIVHADRLPIHRDCTVTAPRYTVYSWAN
jgi:hypothetical protein